MVSQDVVMFNDTIAANVALGGAVDEERGLDCLAAANLAERMPRQLPRAFIPWQATMQRNCLGASGNAWPLPARCIRTLPS